LEKELKNKFAPEFINRLDEIIYFKDLSKEDISKIVDLELNKTLIRSKEIGFELIIEETLKEHLIDVGYDQEYGARPLKRAIQKWVDDYVTEFIIDNNLKPSQTFTLSFDDKDEKTLLKIVKQIKKKKK
jgi:ATP-dependent Clp protease ATP-binding subunit ClpC